MHVRDQDSLALWLSLLLSSCPLALPTANRPEVGQACQLHAATVGPYWEALKCTNIFFKPHTRTQRITLYIPVSNAKSHVGLEKDQVFRGLRSASSQTWMSFLSPWAPAVALLLENSSSESVCVREREKENWWSNAFTVRQCSHKMVTNRNTSSHSPTRRHFCHTHKHTQTCTNYTLLFAPPTHSWVP